MIDLTSICWDDPQPILVHRRELSREASGNPIAVDLGPAIWRVDLISKAIPSADADALYADLLDGLDDTVLVRPRAFTYMHGDDRLQTNVTISAIAGERISLTGLLAGAVVKKGTIFHILSGAKYRLYKALDASDTPGGMRVKPDLRGASVDDAVGLTPPYLEVQILPGSLNIQRDIKGRKRVLFTGMEVPE